MAAVQRSAAVRARSGFARYAATERAVEAGAGKFVGTWRRGLGPVAKATLLEHRPNSTALRDGDLIRAQPEHPQADVLVKLGDRLLKRYIRRQAVRLRRSSLRPMQRVLAVQALVRSRVSYPSGEFFVDGRYADVNWNAAFVGKAVSLDAYLAAGQAVCRENAVLTQVALQDAGLRSRLGGGYLYHQDKFLGAHVWNEVEIGGEWRVFDTTNPHLNGVVVPAEPEAPLFWPEYGYSARPMASMITALPLGSRGEVHFSKEQIDAKYSAMQQYYPRRAEIPRNRNPGTTVGGPGRAS